MEHFSIKDDNSFNFDKWNIPKLSTNEVYTTSWLKSTFKGKYSIKIVEQTFAISSNNEKYQMFGKKFINDSLVKCFKFLHIGSMHVVKPLTRIGINVSVLLCLHDARFINF